MGQSIYDIIVYWIDLIISVPFYTISAISPNLLIVSNSMSYLLVALPYVLPFALFWMDSRIFPDYFRISLIVYFACVFIVLLLRLARFIKAMIPFVG